jgi:hypothetical protein
MRTRPETKFAQDVFDVHFDSSFGNHQCVRDVAIAAAGCQ